MKCKTAEIKMLSDELAKYKTATHGKVAYWVGVNIERFERALRAAETVINEGWPVPAVVDYQTAVNALIGEYAARDPDGNIMQENNGNGTVTVKLHDPKAYNAAIAEVNTKHAGALTEIEAHNAKAREVMAREVEANEYHINADAVKSADVLTAISIAMFLRYGLIVE